MNNLDIDVIKVEGKAAQDLFKLIKAEIDKSDSKEDLPNEDEKKSREELDKQ